MTTMLQIIQDLQVKKIAPSFNLKSRYKNVASSSPNNILKSVFVGLSKDFSTVLQFSFLVRNFVW